MRIVKEFSLEDIKATLMVMNGRYSLKLEKNLLEQTYKFRDGSGIQSEEDIRKVVNSDLIDKIQNQFIQMAENRSKMIENSISGEDHFEQII